MKLSGMTYVLREKISAAPGGELMAQVQVRGNMLPGILGSAEEKYGPGFFYMIVSAISQDGTSRAVKAFFRGEDCELFFEQLDEHVGVAPLSNIIVPGRS